MTDSALSKLTGTLLRSGRSGDYSPLGEAGQPVFRVAGQLREALRRKLGFIEGTSGASYSDHFAVPKTDQLGDVIDWYSNYPGDVIPWSSATEDERNVAREQLRALESQVNQYCDEFNAQQEERSNSRNAAPSSLDAQVFNKLLSKVLHTPDANYIYLVNGFPVLTFWGFVFPKTKVPSDPLLHLFDAPKAITPTPSASIPGAALAAAPELPVPPVHIPVSEAAVVKRSWWRRWFWLLPLLLLLLWLLFGLRYCSPQMANNLGIPDFTYNKSGLDFSNKAKLPDVGFEGFATPKIGSSLKGGDAAGIGSLPNMPGLPDMPGLDSADTESADAQMPDLELQAESPEPQAEPAEQPNAPFDPPQLPDDQNAQATNTQPVSPGQDLQLPSAAPDGRAQFLNGKWKAGAGIQDKNTGKPLRLEYEFNKGKGQVTVQAADGMRCTGDVNAEMAGGNMRINSLGAARCPDGSSFDMPEITCAPGAKSAADCIGNYADTRFPMSMRNTQ